MSKNFLNIARRRFAELLATPNTLEKDWQQLFSECPEILSQSLPLELQPDDIIVGGRPGVSESDFYVYPKQGALVPCCGAVEIKCIFRSSDPHLPEV